MQQEKTYLKENGSPSGIKRFKINTTKWIIYVKKSDTKPPKSNTREVQRLSPSKVIWLSVRYF